MTIKQRGGIFGRNPTFNDVTIEGSFNLGTASFDNLTVDTDTLYVDAANDRVGVNTSSPVTTLESNTTGNGLPASSGTAQANGAFRISSTGTTGIIDIGPNGGAPWIQATDRTDLSQGYTLSLNPNGGNVSIGSGNLVVASGNGIDFSATSGTGTSELFDDYEEGTWTPVIIGGTTAGTGTYSQQDGVYTKVGNLVTVSCYLAFTAHTGTGHMKVSGLPFAGVGSSVDFQAGATQAQYINAGTSATQLAASVVTTASNISLYGFVNNAAKVATQVNASGSGSQLAITLTYRTS